MAAGSGVLVTAVLVVVMIVAALVVREVVLALLVEFVRVEFDVLVEFPPLVLFPDGAVTPEPNTAVTISVTPFSFPASQSVAREPTRLALGAKKLFGVNRFVNNSLNR